MTRSRLLVFPALLLAAALPAQAQAQALKPFTAQYQASYQSLSASATMSLKSQGSGRWSCTLGLNNALASISQATVFNEQAGRYVPLGGADRSSYLGKGKAVTTRYNWNTGQATWSGDVKASRAGPVAMHAGDMDAVLVNLALARDVAAGRTSMSYRMLENGKARTMNYRVIKQAKQTVNGKSVDAVQVVQASGNKQTVAWLTAGVPAPLRIVQYEDGKESFRLQMVSWK